MAVNYIDPGAGALAEGFRQFGEGVALKLTERQRRERALRENPAQMQALAQAYRAANEAGQGQAFLEGIGVRPEFGGQILAFQPTSAERLERARLAGGTPELQARAEGGELQVTGDTFQGIIQRGLVGRQQDNLVLEEIKKGRGLNAELLRNLPEERVETEQAELGARGAEARFTGSVFRRRMKNGIAQLTVDAEELQLQAAMEGYKLDAQTAKAYKSYLDTLDPKSHEYQVALTGLQNPSQLAHIQFHENMGFELSLAMMRARGATDEDRIAKTLQMQGALQEAFKTYESSLEAGADESIISRHADNLNALRLMAEQLQEDDIIFGLDASIAELENDDEIKFVSRYFESNDAKDMFRAMQEEELTGPSLAAGDQLQILMQSDEWKKFTPRDREQLQTGWAAFKDLQRKQQESEGRVLQRARLEARARGSVESLGRGFDPKAEDRITKLYNTLDETAKGYLNPSRKRGP